MSKKPKHPLSNNKIAKRSANSTVHIREDVEDRIGLTDMICYSCNATNPQNADHCRKCGSDELRRRKRVRTSE